MNYPLLNQVRLKPLVAGFCLIAVAVFIAYSPAIFAGFIWDDGPVIVHNPLLRASDGLVKIWARPDLMEQEEHFWPVVYSAFWVEFQYWGTSPMGYHLVNIFLHLVNSVLIWGLLWRLRVPFAFIGAMLFAIHPVHVESVAWIVELKDVLSTFFYLAAAHFIWSFEEHGRKPKYLWYSLPLLALAMFSKSVAVTFPVAYLLILWWKRRSFDTHAWAALISFTCIVIAIEIVDLTVVSRSGTTVPSLTIAEKTILFSRNLFFYLGKLFLPYPLVSIYPKWPLTLSSPANMIAVIAAVIVAVSAFAFRRIIPRGIMTGAAFYVLTLMPMLGVVSYSFLNHSYVADRFQYLASIGPLALAGAATRYLVRNCGCGYARSVRLMIPAVIIAGLVAVSNGQAQYYRNAEALFRHTVQFNSAAAGAQYNLGDILSSRGDFHGATRHYALSFVSAIKSMGKPTTAEKHKAEELVGSRPSGSTYYNLGIVQARDGNINAAEKSFAEAVSRHPGMREARIAHSASLYQLGLTDDATSALKPVIQPSS
jgi:tetratricopeptide (TPR) repeat protein